jgi:ParB/RepB/Spo0J family partition protein
MSKTKKSSTDKTVPSIETTTAAHDGQYGIFKIAEIRKSPDNRKRFNEAALQELAASIKSVGVAQPILIRPVTPTEEAPETFEIVAGERRYRASIIAGISTIPAMCRNLSDLDAAKLRILENLQREDPHPIEEAEGYQLLMLQHGYNADQLADEVNKSRAYIYGRLKLCALTPLVREQFLDDKISASTALLIARIPVPELQVRALDEIINPKAWPNEPLSYRRAAQHIQDRYMLDLATAIFQPTDAKLLAGAGSCTKCPKRTGNQPEVFRGMSADVCTDPDCFGEKRAAHHALTLVQANKKGIPVYEGDEAADIRSKQWVSNSEYVTEATNIYNFMRNAPSTANAGNVKSRLTTEQLPPIAGYLKNDDGSMIAVFSRSTMQSALERAGVCETVEVHAARMKAVMSGGKSNQKDLSAAQIAKQKADKALTDEAETQTAFRVALYKQVRSRVATNGFGLQSLREFAKLSLSAFSLPTVTLKDIYDFDTSSNKAICAHIDQAGLPEIQLLLIDIVVGELLEVNRWDVDNSSYLDDDFSGVITMARNEWIDPESVMREIDKAYINYEELKSDGLASLLKSNPFRINEIKHAITTGRPELVKAMDKAARSLGYVYSIAGYFVRPDEEPGAGQALVSPAVQPAAIGQVDEPSAQPENPAPAVTVDAAAGSADIDMGATEDEHLAEAMEETAPAKKAPKATKPAIKADTPAKTPAAAPKATTPAKKTPAKGSVSVLSPAAAWPFPKPSAVALDKAKPVVVTEDGAAATVTP